MVKELAIEAEIEETYKKRTSKSRALFEEARNYLPYGVGSNFRYFEPYPFFVEEAVGTRIIDADGNEYIDFSMNMGAQLVGHAHPLVIKAIKEQADKGTLYTMPHKHKAALAKEIVKRFPIDQVRFTNSGTETTMHAIRLARGYTGRDKIIIMGGAYHGVHDYVMADPGEDGKPVAWSKGIPAKTLESVLIGTFNDLGSIERLFNSHKGEIAGVLIEPVLFNIGTVLPEDGFLKGLRELCTAEGALLIFDEVKTGVKLEWGGACQYFNIKPDIVCLAKSIGGGLPIGAFGARREIMSAIKLKGGVAHAGTYNANPLAVVAGVVTLRDILTKDVYPKVFRLNKRLIDGYNEVIKRHNLAAHVVGVGPCGTVYWTREPIRNHRDFERFEANEKNLEVARIFFLGMLNQGIIPHPRGWCTEQWTISIQHTEEEIDKHIEAFDKLAPKIAKMQRG
jgi:glutamate-1-semialdehyde 2,1-aminomutase